MTKHSQTTLALILLLAINCVAQNGVSTKLDEYMQAEMKAQQIPGVSLAVIKDGQIVLAKGYGLANVEHQVPAKAETIFQSGSMGKQFTATAVMMLMEDGKLAIDDKLNKYFPDAPEAWRNVTIRHLLTHTSGMTDYPSDFDFRRDYTEDELYHRAKAIPLAFQPGEKWSYSNLGYVMLGILIHKVSGKFYGDFLQERVFKPLEMSTARVISESDIVPNRAAGYRLDKGQLKKPELGFAVTEHNRRRCALYECLRHGEVGRRALHRKAAQTIESRTDVDAGKTQQRSDTALRIRMGSRRSKGASVRSARWHVAGI